MKSNRFASLIVLSLVLQVAALPAEAASPQPPLFSFLPNQLAAAAWYRPGDPPRLINGHLDSSFGQREVWPRLRENLKQAHGTFAINAAEIGHMSSTAGLLPLLKAEMIPVSVEVPGFTQCIDGAVLARAEVLGIVAGDNNPFAAIFHVSGAKDRTEPRGAGWFVTRDGKPLVPDELLFDERMPNLLPEFDPKVLAGARGDWEERKQTARRANGCAASRPPYEQALRGLMQDYVKYLDVAKSRWGGRMPAVSLHWNVNAGWEWRDEKALDAIHAKAPAYFDAPDNYWRIVSNAPQYNSVRYLDRLIDVLVAAGYRPRTVFMDVDWTYDIPYITECLKRHKAALKARGVQMGVNVVEASIGDQEELRYEGGTLRRYSKPRAAANVLYESTLVAMMQFLRGSGIYEQGMQMRVGSWSHRPYETGSQVDEKTPGSMAHAANAIVKLL